MPQLYFPISQINTSILNHVAYQTVESLLRDLSLKTLFNADNITISSDHLADTKSSDGDGNLRITSNRCDVAFTEITNPARIRWDILNFSHTLSYGNSSLDRGDLLPLYRDAVAATSMWEQFSPCNLRLEFSVKFNDKHDAQQLETIITQRYHANSVFNPHDLQYSYMLDKDIAVVLYTFYKMRKTYNLDKHFVTYLRDHSAKEVLFDISKYRETEKRLMIKHHQLQALALLEYDQEKPEPVTVNQISDRWEVRFVYTLQFAKPHTVRIAFPSVIENEWVDNTIMPPIDPTTFTMREMEGLLQQKSFNSVIRQSNKRMPLMIRMPAYEDFNPSGGPMAANGHRPFFITAFTLDEGSTQIDLQNLGDIELHPVVIEMMKAHGRDLFGTTGLYNLTVFSNGVPITPDRLTLTEDLLLTVDASNALKRYHLVLYETTRLMHVARKYLDVMLAHRWFFAQTLMTNMEFMINQGYLKVFPSPSLVALITRMLNDRTIDGYTEQLITAGHASTEIYQTITSAYQYAEYICSIRSPVSERFIYDELLDILISENKVREPYPEPYIRTTRGLSLNRIAQDVSHGPSTPFRVSHTRFSAEQSNTG